MKNRLTAIAAHRSLFLLLLLAAFLRMALFAGFGLGDDVSYADLVRSILEEGYPHPRDWYVFTARPVWLLSIAASVRCLGWNDVALVLPTFLSSLFGILLVGLIGVRAGNRSGGLIAAALLATVPLDAVQATTMTNDIMVSAWIAAGIYVSVGAPTRRGGIARMIWTGLFLLLAFATKANALILPVALAGVALVAPSRRRGALEGLGGTLLAFAAWSLAMYIFTGDAFQTFTIERDFYERNDLFFLGGRSIAESLWLYPVYIFLGASGDLWSFADYGLVLPAGLMIAAWAWRARAESERIFAVWLLAALALMEFSPMRLVGGYIPIHRLPRFLAVCLAPAALLVGFRLEALRQVRPRFVALLVAVFLIFGLARSVSKRDVFVGAMADLRAAVARLELEEGFVRVVADQEGRAALGYLTRFDPRFRFETMAEFSAARALGDYLHLSGGARRIEALYIAADTIEAAPGEILYHAAPALALPGLLPIEIRRISWTAPGDSPILASDLSLSPGSESAGRFVPHGVRAYRQGEETIFEWLFDELPRLTSAEDAWTVCVLLDTDLDSATGIAAPIFGSDYHVRARFDRHGWNWVLDRAPGTSGPAPSMEDVRGGLTRRSVLVAVTDTALGRPRASRAAFSFFVESGERRFEPLSASNSPVWRLDGVAASDTPGWLHLLGNPGR